MDKRKILIAVVLGVVWIVLLIERFFSGGSAVKPAGDVNVEAPAKRTVKTAKKPVRGKTSYPPLELSLKRPGLFGDQIAAVEEGKQKEAKKNVTLPAPQLPILPGEEKQKTEEAATPVDSIQDMTAMGGLSNEAKKFVFIRKKMEKETNRWEVKPFMEGDQVFETQFFVEKIERNVVILKDSSGKQKTLTIIKEAGNGKK